MMISNVVITYKEPIEESFVRLNLNGNFSYEVIPVPRQISVTCGIAQRINGKDINEINKIISKVIVDNNIQKEDINFYEEYYEDDSVKYKKIFIN